MKDRTLLIVILGVAVAILAIEVKLAMKGQAVADKVDQLKADPVGFIKGLFA
jgi:hypothetical protein